MSYPVMPQYGQAGPQQQGQNLYNSNQPQQTFGQQLDHSQSQQYYSSTTPQRPNVAQHHSWSAPPPYYNIPPQYPQREVSSYYPPPPPPRPTPQPGYGTHLNAPSSQTGQYGPSLQPSSPAARPASPLPSSEAEYRKRLEAAGVSQQQIDMILGQQHMTHQASDNASVPTAALQNLSLKSSAQTDDRSCKLYPFNLPKAAPMVFHSGGAKGIKDTYYIRPPHSPHNSRLYTQKWTIPTDRVRPDMTLHHHKDQDIEYSRLVGTCLFDAKHMYLKFPWLDWGGWGQDSPTTTQHWESDTGILNKKVMYWEKDTAHHGKPNLFVLRCKVTDQGLGDEQKPKPDDRVVVTVEVRPGQHTTDVVTIEPGVIEKQDQLDEMMTIALAVQQKMHLDMGLWLISEKGYDFDTAAELEDISFVPADVDGWGGESGKDTPKVLKKQKWKERAKTGAALGKFLGASAQLGSQISIAAGGGGGGGGGGF